MGVVGIECGQLFVLKLFKRHPIVAIPVTLILPSPIQAAIDAI